MKKLVILTLCVFFLVFGTKAFADEIICGRADVLWITLWESDPGNDVPVEPCDVWISFVTENNQGPYTLPATAFGTQLNLALLKALNFQENVSACLVFTIIPPNQFELRIRDIDFEDNDEFLAGS
jgi:hypothetical protein